MGVIKSLSSSQVVDRIKALEDQADLCYEQLELIQRNAWNVGSWASLVKAADYVETVIPHQAYGGKTHQIVLLNLSRIAAIMCMWCREHGELKTAPVSRFRWTRARQMAASSAFGVAAHYFPFCANFPAWHRYLFSADLFEPDGVTFLSLDGPEGRRVSAYQKGLGPISATRAAPIPSVPRPPEMEGLILEVMGTVRSGGLEINYPRPQRLLRYLNDTYQDRFAAAFRRYEGIAVGQYSLREFRMVYAALSAIGGAHEHICFRWSIGRRYPLESAVLNYTRQDWAELLSQLSTVGIDIVNAVIEDLTLGATRLSDLIVHPFVPLDDDSRRLGLLPHFVLASNAEENVLRTCSIIRPRFYNAASAAKESEMMEELRSLESPFRLLGPIKVRGNLPDIDLVVEDSATSTIAICELKWGRKPYSVGEHISRDEELLHGARQLEMLQQFLEANLDFFQKRRYLNRNLLEYKRREYLLVSRDHLKWIPPTNGRAIVGFNPFKAILDKPDLSAGLDSLLDYSWLPVEGKDFKIELKDEVANDVTMRSESFFPL